MESFLYTVRAYMRAQTSLFLSRSLSVIVSFIGLTESGFEFSSGHLNKRELILHRNAFFTLSFQFSFCFCIPFFIQIAFIIDKSILIQWFFTFNEHYNRIINILQMSFYFWMHWILYQTQFHITNSRNVKTRAFEYSKNDCTQKRSVLVEFEVAQNCQYNVSF